MARIAGLLGADWPSPSLLHQNMLSLLRHPGDKTSAAVEALPAVVGVTGFRLPSILKSNSVIVAFDGYFYNLDEFDASCPLKLIASLYERYGFVDTLRRLNGDFALSLYDSAQRVLWLGRDRFGVKPLYYTMSPRGFAFASRPAALLALPGVSSSVSDRFAACFAASHYRTFDNDSSQSPYASISQLPAAHWLCFRDSHISTGSFWNISDVPDHSGSESALADEYRHLLLEAVSSRLRVADRPAFTLSGGMDSSSVLGCAVRFTGQKQQAFSSVYEDKTYDESDDIRSILDECVSQWHPVLVGSPDVFDIIRRMIYAHDEPVATATWLSHFLLCQAATLHGVGSLFGGLGGDELNAGEYEHFFFHFADLQAAGDLTRLQWEVERWAHYHDHPIYRKDRQVVADAFSRVVDLARPGRCLPDRRRLERYAAVLHPDFFDLRSFTPVMDHPFGSYLKNRTWQDLTRETVPCCLRAEDRHAAAFGLEHFTPFLDHRLVEFMFRIPGTLKYRDGVTKHLLRVAMRGILPEETRTRVKKTGWNAPAHLWFSGPGRQPLLDLVHSRAFRERGIYNVREVERLIDEHEAIVTSGQPREHHMMFLWQLVNLELWFQSIPARSGLLAA